MLSDVCLSLVQQLEGVGGTEERTVAGRSGTLYYGGPL